MLMVLVVAALVIGGTGWGATPTGGQVTSFGASDPLPWRTWLLVDPNSEGQSTASSSRSPAGDSEEEGRRITAKSLFIAPAFSGGSQYHLPECAEGYRADKLGRCVKLVRVNQVAQRDFLLNKLSAMYAAPTPQVTEPASGSASTGPLQVSLPIATAEENDNADEEDSSQDSSVEVAVVMADVLQENNGKQLPSHKPQTILALWNIAGNGTLAEKETKDIQPGEGQLPSSSTATTTVTMPANIPQQLPDDDRLLLLTPPTAILTLKTGTANRRNASSPIESAGQNLGEATKETEAMSDLGSVMLSSNETVMSMDEPISDFSLDIGEDKNISQATFSEVMSNLQLNLTSDSETNSINVLNASNVSVDKIVSERLRTNNSNKISTTQQVKRPNSFVRFPTESNVLDPVYMHTKTSSSSGNTMVKFPDSQPSSSIVFPSDQSSIRHTETFWWLPPGWRLDETRHKPMLLRFWARVPLLRDHMFDSHLPYHHQQVLGVAQQRQQRMLDMHKEASANLQRSAGS